MLGCKYCTQLVLCTEVFVSPLLDLVGIMSPACIRSLVVPLSFILRCTNLLSTPDPSDRSMIDVLASAAI